MPFEDFLTELTCAACKSRLVRVPQSLYRIAETEPDAASVVCVECGAGGRYEEVTEQGAGLIGGLLTQEQCVDIVEKLRVAPHGR